MTRDGNPTYVLVPGAGGSAWYWHRLVDELRRRGVGAVAVDLPAGDDAAGLPEYAAVVVDAIGDRSPVVLVAQSMAGFAAPLVCERVPIDLLVLLNAMIPAPHETAGAWWDNTGQSAARAAKAASDGRDIAGEFDVFEEFFHDAPADVVAEAKAGGDPPQSDTPFGQTALQGPWPDVPTRVLVGRDDRFFPAEFQARVAKDRLGITADVMPGGHLLALSQPLELAARLEAYWAERD